MKSGGSPLAQARLVYDLSLRDLRFRFAGSHLGLLWAFFVPLVSSVVMVLVFGVLMKGTSQGGRYTGIDFTTLYFLAFAPWLLFSDVTARATTLVRENRALIRNLQFNHRLIPISICASSIVAHAVILLICAALIAFKGYAFSPWLAALPLYFLLLLVFTLGTAYLVAAISVYLIDMVHALPIALNLFFFMTPVLYTPYLVEQNGSPLVKRLLLDWNPLTHFVEGFRTSLVRVPGPFDTDNLLACAGWAVVMLGIGYFTYRRLEKGFADVL